MNDLKHKQINAKRRAHRVRTSIVSSSQRPRLSVNISNYHVTAQIIDDSAGRTLAYATTVGNKTVPANMTAKAEFIGVQIAERAKKAKIKSVVLDRGQRIYHGRIKALTTAARNNGLEI